MPILPTSVDTRSPAYQDNVGLHEAMLAEVRQLEDAVRARAVRAEAKFRERKQLLPRERVALALDRDAPFLELSSLAGLGMHEDDGKDDVLGGGIITGIGFVSGVRCMIVAHDSAIKGGAVHPMGVKKLVRAQSIALENKLPTLQLVESAGANLLLQSEMFVEGGAIFANMARLSAAGLPIVSIVHGSSTAGGAYQSGLSDYIILIRDRSRIFLAGPPLLKAATGEIASENELGGADLHFHDTGTGEYLAQDDRDAIRIAREIFASLPKRPVAGFNQAEPPAFNPAEILGIVPPDYRKPYDVREIVARVVDGSNFLEFKQGYGFQTVCGHARVEGFEVGIIGNNGPIDAAGAAKAAQFIQLCCQSGTALIFLQNTTGFLVGLEMERAGIVKHGSKLIQAVTNAGVPKITIQVGGSFGAGHYAMCGRAFGPRFVFAWPNSRTAVMGGEQAGKVMRTVAEESARVRKRELDLAGVEATQANIVAEYDRQSAALFATARIWDDGIIDPRHTRKVVGFCLATCAEAEAARPRETSFGVARF